MNTNHRCICHDVRSETKIFRYCPHCGRKLTRDKLTPTGDHARDRLVRARLTVHRMPDSVSNRLS